MGDIQNGTVLDVPTPLLPCPFCGADVTMGKNREGAKIIYFQVECDECGAIAGSGYTTEPAAAKNWNRRANVEVTGAAPKGGAASSDRRERPHGVRVDGPVGPLAKE